MIDDRGGDIVPVLFVRPPGMTDEEFLELCACCHTVPQRMIFGATP